MDDFKILECCKDFFCKIILFLFLLSLESVNIIPMDVLIIIHIHKLINDVKAIYNNMGYVFIKSDIEIVVNWMIVNAVLVIIIVFKKNYFLQVFETFKWMPGRIFRYHYKLNIFGKPISQATFNIGLQKAIWRKIEIFSCW